MTQGNNGATATTAAAAGNGAAGRIGSVAELEALYGAPMEVALAKELDYLTPHYRRLVEAAPFAVLATVGPEGLDCSPRGDPAGFARVPDPKTVLIPDRRGNNRLDSLKNIVRDPRVALLFLIPGVNETMRVNGRADLLADPALLESFAIRGKTPRSVIRVAVESAYYQCPKALVRSRLWDPETRIPRSALPSSGEMLRAVSGGAIDGEEWDRNYPARLRETIY